MSAEGPGLAFAKADLEHHAPVDVDGARVEATWKPDSAEALAEALRAIAEADRVAIPLGAGRHLALGNPPERADLFLSTAGLADVECVEAAEGVCRAGAGASLGALRAAAREVGAELPLEGPDASTLGGVLATAAVGPRTQAYGPARDAVLGLDVALVDGSLTRCGGRVVKNVTGYDLAKLYVGSLGTLGVITAAWLRLRPLPETLRVQQVGFDALDAALECALAVSRRPTARVCVLRVAAGRAPTLTVELGGDAAAVEESAAAIGGEVANAAAIDALGAWFDEDVPLRVRVAALPSELPPLVAALSGLGADLSIQPGAGFMHVAFSGELPDAAKLRAAASVASGPLRVERAPLDWKREACVFGASDAEIALHRSLKQRFDPTGALGRGRFAGRV